MTFYACTAIACKTRDCESGSALLCVSHFVMYDLCTTFCPNLAKVIVLCNRIVLLCSTKCTAHSYVSDRIGINCIINRCRYERHQPDRCDHGSSGSGSSSSSMIIMII